MNINVENSIKNKKDLDIHPDWWKVHENDLEEALRKKVDRWTEMRDRISKYEEITIHEASLIKDLDRYISIITKD